MGGKCCCCFIISIPSIIFHYTSYCARGKLLCDVISQNNKKILSVEIIPHFGVINSRDLLVY